MENQVPLRLILQDVERLDLASIRVHTPVGGSTPRGVAEPLASLAHREVPLCLTNSALLRRDIDYAVGGLCTIERGSCRALDHLQTLDHRRVEVVNPGDVPAPTFHPVGRPDSVDVDQRSVIHPPHSRAATDLDRGGGADVTRPLLDHYARHPTTQEIREVNDGLHLSYAGIQPPDGVPDLSSSGSRGSSCHENLI